MNRRAFLAAAAALPFGLTATGTALAATRGGTPLVLVTADLESEVVVYDLASARVVRRVRTPAGPKSIETVGDGALALVAHTAVGAISLIDVSTLRVRHVLRGFHTPRYTAAVPDGETALVTDAGTGELVTVDLFAGRVARRLSVGPHARHLSLDSTSMKAWVALGFSAPAIAVIDLSATGGPSLDGRIAPPFPAHDVVFVPGTSRIWVSSGADRRLAVYDADARRVLFTLAAGQPPQHITIAGGDAYVTSDDAVRVHRLRDGKLLRTTQVPAGSYNVTEGWGRILTPSLERGTLAVLDEHGRLLARPVLARAAHDACFVAGS
jgi:DNA-binding beta-propeller fold protein YncE